MTLYGFIQIGINSRKTIVFESVLVLKFLRMNHLTASISDGIKP